MFNNLFKKYKKEQRKRQKNLLTFEDVTSNEVKNLPPYLRQYVPISSKNKVFTSCSALKCYLKNRIKTVFQRDIEAIEKRLKELSTYQNKDFPKQFTIVIEYKRNRTWGYNPTASVFVVGEGEGDYSSGSIGGCGYDKESTAFAQVANQIQGIKYLLYKEANRLKNKNKKLSEIFGYGSGYGVFPSFSGGVGTSCYYSIFEKIGYKMTKTASTSSLDVYTISKI
jgi:hypothetical protein